LLLAIELDGESHTETVEHDRLRTAYLEEQNIRVLRFTNEDVMKRFDAVCEAISLVPPLQGAVSEADWGL
jgi:very-short-patch-repair endonuclease